MHFIHIPLGYVLCKYIFLAILNGISFLHSVEARNIFKSFTYAGVYMIKMFE